LWQTEITYGISVYFRQKYQCILLRFLSENNPQRFVASDYFHCWLWLWPEKPGVCTSLRLPGPAMLVYPKIAHEVVSFQAVFMVRCGWSRKNWFSHAGLL